MFQLLVVDVPSDLPWVAGAIFMLVFFCFFERYAFNHPDRLNSLSRSMYDLGSKFPLSILFFGMVVDGLGVHFYWHWCPPGSNSFGMLMNLMDLG